MFDKTVVIWINLIFFRLTQVIENHVSPPLIIVSPPVHVESVRNCLMENDYFGLDTKKVQSSKHCLTMIIVSILPFFLSSYNVLWNNLQVWVLEELELPIVSITSEAGGKKVLMKSPWEIIKKPAGSGGIFSLLSSNKILDSLNEMGVQYTQV